MQRYSRAALTLRMVTSLLFLSALTACHPQPPAILQDSATIQILPGDLPKSPTSKGWLLSDQATAKLLEAAEKCQKVK